VDWSLTRLFLIGVYLCFCLDCSLGESAMSFSGLLSSLSIFLKSLSCWPNYDFIISSKAFGIKTALEYCSWDLGSGLPEVSLFDIFFTCNFAETTGLAGTAPWYLVGDPLIADELTLIVATFLSVCGSLEIALILVDAEDTLKTLPPLALSWLCAFYSSFGVWS